MTRALIPGHPTSPGVTWTLFRTVAGVARVLGNVCWLPSDARIEQITQFRRRQAIIGAVAVLLLLTVEPFLPRREVHASTKSPPEIVAVKILVPEPKYIAPEPTPTPAPVSSKPVFPIPTPAVVLRDQVQLRWEKGQYAEANSVVKDLLAKDPDNAEALAWKKRISATQQAEAAFK